MKGINFFLNPPFFCFDGNCGKVCPTDSDYFGLLMWLDRNNIHINKPKKSESVGQTLPQLPSKQKKGGFKKKLIPFIKLHEIL
jgi:hypothetical protein